MDTSAISVPKEAVKTTPPCKSEKSPFVFKPPPEAPVFYPTQEEFDDPLQYINRISKEGLKYGILKIIPPDGWKPPFALNYENFKFKPRIQKINELEASTRIKLNFLSKVLKAVAQEGKVPKVPYIEKSLLDLHRLHLIVCKEGGHETVTKKKKWNDVAAEMGLTSKTVGQTLRQHYENCIIPYLESVSRDMMANDDLDSDAKLLKLTNIRELKSLEFLGPGPKMPTCNYNFSSSMKTRTRHKKVQYEFDPLAKYMCQTCGRDDSDGTLANCKTCYDKYHLVCLQPPLNEIPKDWVCPKCLVACDPNNPYENYGFETAEKEYNLKQFGQMADKFKHNHFKTAGRLVPLSKCEEEYWRLMGCMDSSVTVEYGADLSVLDVGSGFPLADSTQINGCSSPAIKKYAESNWNLNNLSVLKQSALRHIVTNISGMKVPWVYVGMCFSTFCWHNEDHWSYSINYLHWGEPKTWYGVSGTEADKFEREIKFLVPELFEDNSNILHELVTTMNPNLLMERGVPIYRTDQKEGEFVVTFPRAYHAGFNQGFNFAEACNFAPADWIPMGRKSVLYYGHFKRTCVFSHDELICKIAENAQDVDKDICIAAFNDMKDMIFTEMNRRSHIKNSTAVTKFERFDFSFIKDEDRQCKYCKTTCFLSAIYCPCSANSLVCLDHLEFQCSCETSGKIMRFHYTFSELVDLLLKFVDIIDDVSTLLNLILAMYEYKEAKPFTLCKILEEANRKRVSPCEYLKEFKKHVSLTLRCCIISRFLVQTLVVRKEVKENLSFDSINFFFKCLKSLPWNIPEIKSFENLVNSIKNFQNYLVALLDNDKLTKRQLEACLRIIKLLNVSFNEVPLLEQKLNEIEDGDSIVADNLNGFGDVEGDIDNVDGINDLLKKVADWNNEVKSILEYDNKVKYDTIVSLVVEGKKLKIDSAFMNKLNCIMAKAKKWIEKSKKLLSGDLVMYPHRIEEFIKRGKLLPVEFESMTSLQNECSEIKMWIESVKYTYSRKDSTETLLQILWPRKFKPRGEYIGMQSTEEPSIDSCTFPEDFSNKAVKNAIDAEYKSLMTLRWENAQKKTLPYKLEKIKCICKYDITDGYVCCEMCQTIYHYACFPKVVEFNKEFSFLPFKNPYCSYCIRTTRPNLTILDQFLKSAAKLKLKTPEYYILKYKVDSWHAVQKKITAFLNLRDVNYAYQRILNHDPKDYNDVATIQLHDRRMLALRSLLQRIDIAEVSLKFSIRLWTMFEATKSDLTNRRRVPRIVFSESNEPVKIKVNSTQSLNENKKPAEKKPTTRKRKNSNVQNKPVDTVVKKRKPSRKKADGSSDEMPSSLLERFTVDQLRSYLNEEMCAALTCLRPSEEEVHWVQCDGKCRLWFHMKCVNVGLDEVKDDDDYICLKCLFVDDKSTVETDGVHHNPVGL